MKTTISLKELLDFEFTANEDGKIVAEISLEYKGIFNIIPYKENPELEDLVNKLIALDYLEV